VAETISFNSRLPADTYKKLSDLAHVLSLKTGRRHTVSGLTRTAVERLLRDEAR
jgi:hypothetical protein